MFRKQLHCRLAVFRALDSRPWPTRLTRLTLTAGPWVTCPVISALAATLPALAALTLYGYSGSDRNPTCTSTLGLVQLLTTAEAQLHTLRLLEMWGWPPVTFHPLRFCTRLSTLEVTTLCPEKNYLLGELLGNYLLGKHTYTSWLQALRQSLWPTHRSMARGQL